MLGNDREAAISQLVVVAFFFAMRSCEYSGVQGERLTTVVGVDDIRFWTNDKLVAVDDHDKMRSADSVSVTFRRQKNRDNGVVVTQHRNNRLGKGEMCPVRTLADLVVRIRSYTEFQTTGGTNVGINTFKSRNEGAKIEWITSKEVLKQLMSVHILLLLLCYRLLRTVYCIYSSLLRYRLTPQSRMDATVRYKLLDISVRPIYLFWILLSHLALIV